MATVLIVDDDDLLREVFGRLLSEHFDVLMAPGGAEGLAILELSHVDVILSDQVMPGMTGDVFLSHAARRWPEIERILITGYASMDAVVRGINAGNIGYYLEKPVDAKVLREVLARGVERTRERRGLREAGRLVESWRPQASDSPGRPVMLWGAGECLVVDEVIPG